jgi:hypothetical protein
LFFFTTEIFSNVNSAIATFSTTTQDVFLQSF